MLLNSAEGYIIDVPDQSENITLKISCSALRPRIDKIDDACGTMNTANPFLVPVVVQLGAQLLKFNGGGESMKLEQVLTDLVCLMMETLQEDDLALREHRSLVDVLHDRLASYMRQHFRNTEPSPNIVATAHRISTRYLHRVFCSRGTTFGDVLMEMRLQEASRMLRQAHLLRARISIGEISYSCGFISQAHFSARFRQRFGTTPRDFG